jgi:predicted 2-oxoglutarate/Fe(II)-dependent dioxygenase YbiX
MSVWVIGITTVISTAATVYGQQQAAKAQTKAAEYNNILADQEAKNVELQNAEQLKRDRIKQRKAMAEIRSRLAQNGTLTTEGTPLAILGESSANFNLGIQDAARAANMQAASLRAQGTMGLWEADQGQQAANISSVAAIGEGVSNYYRLKKP